MHIYQIVDAIGFHPVLLDHHETPTTTTAGPLKSKKPHYKTTLLLQMFKFRQNFLTTKEDLAALNARSKRPSNPNDLLLLEFGSRIVEMVDLVPKAIVLARTIETEMNAARKGAKRTGKEGSKLKRRVRKYNGI